MSTSNLIEEPKTDQKSKNGRPHSEITQKALRFLNKYPQSTPQHLAKALGINSNHARQLKHRYANRNNNKLTNSENRHFNISQLSPSSRYEQATNIILDFIYHKQAQNKRFVKCHKAIFGNHYTTIAPNNRYDGDLALETIDRRGRERAFITRLKNKETFIQQNHIHHHNNRQQKIEYHIGDHDLTKFLSSYLGLEYKARIYFQPNHEKDQMHFISTDSSGLDICCLDCFRRLLDKSIQTRLEGTALLQASFIHGKYMVGNTVKFEW